MRLAFLLLTISLSSLLSSADARTWIVLPDGTGDAATISAALDSSAVGDTVELACGTYYESALSLKSGVVLRGASGDPASAVVDGQWLAPILVAENVDATAEVVGLTLLNGAPGAQLIDASPHFRNVSIEECSLRGALISGLSSPTFEACVFAGNSASGGGAVACTSGSTADFTECEFIGNGAGYAASGGAVSAQPANTTLRFFSCRFESNEVGNGGDGGAIASGGHLEVHDSLFLGNSVFDTFSSAIRSYAGGTLTVTSSTFAGNPGVAAIQTDGTTTLTRCLFAGSDRVWLTGTFDVSCTNVENGWMFNPELENANGNFSSDPLFCAPAAGNYHLQWGSPCLVANSPAGCGQIGAFGPGGCNVVSVEPETWARIKAQYR